MSREAAQQRPRMAKRQGEVTPPQRGPGLRKSVPRPHTEGYPDTPKAAYPGSDHLEVIHPLRVHGTGCAAGHGGAADEHVGPRRW